MKSRIYIVDDHPLVREGLTARIARHPELTVSGESGDANEAFEQLSADQPDIALIDLSLKEASGLNLIHQVHARYPAIRLIAISMHDESIYGSRVRSAGAMGYINKREISDQVIEAIHRVLSGKPYFSMGSNHDSHKLFKLSNRESQVFELIAQGMTPPEIADNLHLSVKTVETHRENIKNKLDLKSSHELTVFATRMASTL